MTKPTCAAKAPASALIATSLYIPPGWRRCRIRLLLRRRAGRLRAVTAATGAGMAVAVATAVPAVVVPAAVADVHPAVGVVSPPLLFAP